MAVRARANKVAGHSAGGMSLTCYCDFGARGVVSIGLSFGRASLPAGCSVLAGVSLLGTAGASI